MRFSRRTPQDWTPNHIARLAAERRQSGAGLLDLTETNPARLGLPRPHAAPVLEGPPPYDPHPLGSPAARDAVAHYFAARDLPAHAERMLLTASTSEAYAHLFRLLADPGDEVLISRPSYPLFEPLAELESVRLTAYPLRLLGDAWRPDLDAVARLAGPRTRAVMVVHPHNPTGALFAADEARQLEALCAGHEMAMVADEVFADFAFARGQHASFALAERALTFVLGGLSKTCGRPDAKLAWTLAAGPPVLVSQAMERLAWIGDAFLSTSAVTETAAPELLQRRQEFLGPARERIAANEQALRRVLDGAVHLLPVPGGWSGVLCLPAGADEDVWVERLLERGVLVHPGYYFDFPEEGYLVVSLLARERDLTAGAERIAELAAK